MSTDPCQQEMSKPSLEVPGPSAAAPWVIEGGLSVYTVDNLRIQMIERLGLANALVLDLSRVDGCDCAGLQLLCAAQKSARLKGQFYQVTQCSASVLKAAESIGLSQAEFCGSAEPTTD